MRACLRSFDGLSVDAGTYSPADDSCDGVWIRMTVGPLGGQGNESFDVLICTPEWLRKTIRAEGPQIGRHRLVMEPLDLAEAREFLRTRIESLEAANWTELGEKVGRLGFWEFEDYAPAQ